MEGFDTLQRMYCDALPEKRMALEKEWRALVTGAIPDPHVLALRHQLHQLAGSGGAYGFDAMGEMARELEKGWVQWLALPPDARPDARRVCADLAVLMQLLQQAMRFAAMTEDEI